MAFGTNKKMNSLKRSEAWPLALNGSRGFIAQALVLLSVGLGYGLQANAGIERGYAGPVGVSTATAEEVCLSYIRDMNYLDPRFQVYSVIDIPESKWTKCYMVDTGVPYLSTNLIANMAWRWRCSGQSNIYWAATVPTTCSCDLPLVWNDTKKACDRAPNTYKNSGNPGCLGVGNPVHSGTGNKYQQEVDYLAVSGIPLSLIRHYNSQIGLTGNLGVNWRAFGSVNIQNTVTVLANRPDHKTIVFVLQNGQWISDPDVDLKLTKLTDSSGNTTGWKIVTKNGDVETYSAAGTITSYANRSGLGYTIADISSPITVRRMTSSVGHVLQLNYGQTSTGANNVLTLTDPAGGVTAYGYDTNNNLATVTYPDGLIRQYHYEHPTLKNALTGITDERGVRYATYGYDAQGRATLTEHAGGAGRYTISFGSNTTTVTDALGTARTQTFEVIQGVYRLTSQSQPGGSGCGPAAEGMTYDANGNVASRTDFNGRKTTYGYDLSRNLETTRTEGLSSSGAALPETRTITTAWHTTWRLPVQINEYAGATAAGNPLRRTQIGYDDKGNVTSRSITDVAAGQTRTWTTATTYSVAVPGLVLQKVEDGPRTDVADTVTTDYYPHDEACAGAALGTGRDKGCRGQIKRITDAIGQVTQFTRYNAHGQVEEITDPNGVTTTLTYDLRQRLTSRSTAGETTSYQYDPVGQLTRLTLPDGSYLSYTYDGARRLTAIADSLGNSIAYTLDAAGNRTKEEIRDPQSALVKTLTRAYDALGRLQTLTGVGDE